MAAAFFTAFLAAFFATFFNRNGNDSHRLNWNIHCTRLHGCNLVDNIQAFNHFAEHGIVAIKMRRTSYGLVNLTLFGR